MTDRLDAIRQKAEAYGYDTKGDGDDVRFLLAEIDALRQRAETAEQENNALKADASMYCPNCGACGEDGCCPAPKCSYFKHYTGKTGERLIDALEDVKEADKQYETVAARVLELVAERDAALQRLTEMEAERDERKEQQGRDLEGFIATITRLESGSCVWRNEPPLGWVCGCNRRAAGEPSDWWERCPSCGKELIRATPVDEAELDTLRAQVNKEPT